MSENGFFSNMNINLYNTTLHHFDASLKDLGKKWFAFSKMDIRSVETHAVSVPMDCDTAGIVMGKDKYFFSYAHNNMHTKLEVI